MTTRFLVIRFSSIGDVVLTSPVIRCIKEQIDDAEIHFVTKERYKSIVESNPRISRVHTLKESMSDLLSVLRKEKYDYVIDLHNNYRSSRIKRNLKVKSFSVVKLNFRKMLLIRFKINRLPHVHVVDRYLDTLSSFNIKNDKKGLEYHIPRENAFNQDELPAPFQKGYVAFVIAGTYHTKKLPSEKVSAICEKIDQPVILLGGKSEFDLGESILSQSKGNVLNYAGKISLDQSASLVENANVVLTNDTGLMHIAAAFHKKILSFWGNTVPMFGMYPYLPAPESIIVENNALKCRPCSKLGHKKCPKKHFKCMIELDINPVVDWINQNY